MPQRGVGAIGAFQWQVLAQAFRTEAALVDRVFLIAAHRDDFAAFDAYDHAATHRAVAAGGLDPALGNFLLRQISVLRVATKGELVRLNIKAERFLNFLYECHR